MLGGKFLSVGREGGEYEEHNSQYQGRKSYGRIGEGTGTTTGVLPAEIRASKHFDEEIILHGFVETSRKGIGTEPIRSLSRFFVTSEHPNGLILWKSGSDKEIARNSVES